MRGRPYALKPPTEPRKGCLRDVLNISGLGFRVLGVFVKNTTAKKDKIPRGSM